MPMGNINQLSAGELRTSAPAIEPSPNMDSEENDSMAMHHQSQQQMAMNYHHNK